MENWKDIKGYECAYQVSDQGNVRVLKRQWNAANGAKREHAGMLLSQNPNPKGYLKVTLCVNSKRKTFSVHRLVAEAFVPNPNNLPEVNHKKGNKKDNRATELEWTTTRDNVIHSFKTLGRKAPSGSLHNKSKKVFQRNILGKVIVEFGSVGEASRATGINRPNIVTCLGQQRKSAGGYLWTWK